MTTEQHRIHRTWWLTCLLIVFTFMLGTRPFTVVQAQVGTPFPVTVLDQTPTNPLSPPDPSGSGGFRYVSGFGADDTFTLFFEDRDDSSRINYVTTTSGPTGFSIPTQATLSSAPFRDTHFVIKDWPVTIGGTTYAYRAWGADGNNPNHRFYVSNDLTNWTEPYPVFQIPNDPSFTDASGFVYYGFHDVIRLNGTYYAFAESNGGQTMIVRSATGQNDWAAFDSIGGTNPAWGPLYFDPAVYDVWGPTPSGSFFELGGDRGYGKIHLPGNDSAMFLAINLVARPSMPPAALEVAFIDPANWTWNDGTAGSPDPGIALLSATADHDVREAWLVPQSDPNAPWVIIYTADYPGVGVGPRALGWIGVTPPPVRPPRTRPTATPSPSPVVLFDPAISKLGFLVPGELGVTGEQLEWVITVHNLSNGAGYNVVVADTVRDGLRIDGVTIDTGTYAIHGQTVTVTIPVLNPGSGVQFNIFTTVVEGAIVENTACLVADNLSEERCATALPITALPLTGETPWWHIVLTRMGLSVLLILASRFSIRFLGNRRHLRRKTVQETTVPPN